MSRVLAAIVLLLALSACGENRISEEEDDRHFQMCVRAGGSYHNDGYGEWSCTMPEAPETSGG